MEENSYFIGDLLAGVRTEKEFGIEDVAEGICGKSTLERVEEGEEKTLPDIFLINLLLNRMGMCTGKFEFYYDKGQEEKEEIRNELAILGRSIFAEPSCGKMRQEKKWDVPAVLCQKLGIEKDASYKQALEAYIQSASTMWEKRWGLWRCLIHELTCGDLSKESVDAWEELRTRKLYYTEMEWEFLYTLAAYFWKKGNYMQANMVYTQMYQNAVTEKRAKKGRRKRKKIQHSGGCGVFSGETNRIKEDSSGHGMDEERQLEILPEFCLVYGGFLWEYEAWRKDMIPFWDAEEIFLHGIHLNRKFSRNYFLYELMESYCKLRYQRIRSGQEEICPDLLQYEQYLVAFEMAQGKYDMAKKRLDFMKEELKWENTTLVHTCNVLARKQN